MNNTRGIPRVGLLPYSRDDGSQYFPQDYLDAIEMIGAEHSPGFETTTGSLSQALSQAGGIALARHAGLVLPDEVPAGAA